MMKKIILFLLFSSTLCAQGWEWQYPKPQGNTLLGLQVINENTVVAVGELGTIIKTTDGGETWEVKHHACGMSGHLVSVYFQDTVTGWAVGSSGTMLKTTDAGETWIKQDTVTSRGLTSIYFVNADTGWVVGTGSCETGAIVLKTTDGGDNWTSQIIGFHVHTFNSVHFTNDSTGWIVGDGYWGNEIFKTTDCGETWIQQDIEPRVYCMRKIQFIDEHTGFMVSEFGDFLRTTNGGESWEYQNLSDIDPDRLKYAFPYSLHFVNADTGWIAGGDYYGYILKTTDGGENWVEEDIDEVQGQLYNIQFCDTEYGWAIGRFGLIYRTEDGGESWAVQREGTNCWLTSVSFADSQHGWVVGEEGTVLHTNDGGKNWYEYFSVKDQELVLRSVFVINKNEVWISGGGKAFIDLDKYKKAMLIYINTKNDQWDQIETPLTYSLNSIYFLNEDIGWVVGTEGMVLKTENGGESWEKRDIGYNNTIWNVHFINLKVGFILFYRSNKILKTIDGGETWSEKEINPYISVSDIFFIDENTSWIVGDYHNGKNVFKTEDGGETWVSVDIGSNKNLYSVYFVDEYTGYIAEGSRYILKTTDGGETWNYQKNTPSKGFSSLFFIDSNIGWAVGDGIFNTTTGGNTSINRSYHSSKMPQEILLFQNYPNPFNPSTTIRYVISKPSYVSVKVYDLLGREVETLVKEYQSAGKYTIHWTGENYPSGLYLYQLQTGEFCETRKFMLIK